MASADSSRPDIRRNRPRGIAQQPAPQRAPGTLTEGVTAVLVDVVVRDRKNQPVRDLTAGRFRGA